MARFIVAGTVGFAAFEAGWIALRAGLGMPSHFAADPVGAAVYGVMGAVAVFGCLLAALFGGLVAWRGDAAMDAPMRTAIAAGFLVAGVLGAVTGIAIGANHGPYVGGLASDAGSLPPFFWSRSGGDLRIAHFVAVHAMQVLPLLAWALRQGGIAMPRAWIGAATLGWVGLTFGGLALALAGRPL